MQKIFNKGHRIRASDKHLVYHFSIGTLLFVFVAVLLLLNIKQLMRTDWEHFSLLENGLTLSPYNFITILIATGVCALVVFLYYHFCYDSFKKLLHRQKLARMVLENKWYEADTVQDSGFFTDRQSRSREKIVWFPKIYYQMEKGLLHIRCEITLGKYQDQLLRLEDKLESGLYCGLTDKTLHDGYIEYTLLYDMIANRITIDEVRAENGCLRLMKNLVWEYDALPHALIAGGTGGGKTYFLMTLIEALLHTNAVLYILDPKNADLADLGTVMGNVYHTKEEMIDEQELSVPADPNVRNFSFTLVDGRVYFRENDRMQPASVSMTAENRIKGLIQIRDCVRKLIEYQTEDYPEEMIRTEQENLNRLYDAYTAKYGLINSRGNYLAFASDESYFLLCSLEVLDDEGNFKRKADMFTKRTIKSHREITSVETASEALALSIGEKARVDLPYMEQLTGKTQAELVQDLQGVIFKVPNCEPVSYVAADEYLSGNVRNKLTVAELVAKNDPELAVNVEALKKVIPKDLSAAEISVRLGATWIPQEDIQRFVMELLTPSSYAAGRLKVRYTPINGDWFIENKSSDMGNVKADSTYGTKRASAYRIIEDTLNLRDTRIFDYVYDEHGNKKAVFNAKETTAAQAKQEAIYFRGCYDSVGYLKKAGIL